MKEYLETWTSLRIWYTSPPTTQMLFTAWINLDTARNTCLVFLSMRWKFLTFLLSRSKNKTGHVSMAETQRKWQDLCGIDYESLICKEFINAIFFSTVPNPCANNTCHPEAMCFIAGPRNYSCICRDGMAEKIVDGEVVDMWKGSLQQVYCSNRWKVFYCLCFFFWYYCCNLKFHLQVSSSAFQSQRMEMDAISSAIKESASLPQKDHSVSVQTCIMDLIAIIIGKTKYRMFTCNN